MSVAWECAVWKYQILKQNEARAPVQNQHTRKLISARKTSHKHNKYPSRLRQLSSGMRVNVPCIYWECTSDGVYVPCIYSRARWKLLQPLRLSLLCFCGFLRRRRRTGLGQQRLLLTPCMCGASVSSGQQSVSQILPTWKLEFCIVQGGGVLSGVFSSCYVNRFST